jgi:RNA polymerase sigma factor (sigma-70 family)
MGTDLADLVAAADAGDQDAWNALVDRFAGLVWHVIRGFHLPRAIEEDAFQVTWLRAIEHLATIREPDRLGSWLARTATNECIRAVRTRQGEALGRDADLDADPQASADRSLLTADRDRLLWQAFATLPAGCQRLLRLLLADPPLPYEEVSNLLGMPVGSIGPTRARCLHRLRTSKDVHLFKDDA